MTYFYKQQSDWTKLTATQRWFLRSEYRWMRKHGYSRVDTKGTLDRVALMLTRHAA